MILTCNVSWPLPIIWLSESKKKIFHEFINYSCCITAAFCFVYKIQGDVQGLLPLNSKHCSVGIEVKKMANSSRRAQVFLYVITECCKWGRERLQISFSKLFKQIGIWQGFQRPLRSLRTELSLIVRQTLKSGKAVKAFSRTYTFFLKLLNIILHNPI